MTLLALAECSSALFLFVKTRQPVALILPVGWNCWNLFEEKIIHEGLLLHSKGLKLGICSNAVSLQYYGSYNFEETDAKTFAEWGIDYLK